MIQFNLLPDVKIEFIRTRYRKRMIMLISVAVSAACFVIFALLFLYVRVNQPKHISDLDKDIKNNVSQIQSTPDLDKILTIQNQLNSLPDLHDKKVVSSRVMDYLTILTPNQATISDVEVDFTTNTMTLKGNADNLVTVNKFADTLKFTEYKVNDASETKGKAFKDVVLKSFSVASGSTATTSAYELSFAFEPAIFMQVKQVSESATEQVTLTVPSIISTRSATEKPAALFAPQPDQESTEGEDR